MKRLLLPVRLLTVALLLIACENHSEVKDSASKVGVADNGPYRSSLDSQNREEAVTPPNNISGSYLACRRTSVPGDTSGNPAIGCGFYDKATSQKLEVSTVARDIRWDSDASKLPNTVQVQIFKSNVSQRLPFDVYYAFKGAGTNIDSLLQQFSIVMAVTEFDGSQTTYANTSYMTRPAGTPIPSDQAGQGALPEAIGIGAN